MLVQVWLPQLINWASFFPEWDCEDWHIKNPQIIKNSPSSPPHIPSMCWTLPISEDHLLLLFHFCHAQILIAIKSDIFVVRSECRMAYFRTISSVMWFLPNFTGASTCTVRLKRCKWVPCTCYCIKKELQTLIFTVPKLTFFHLDLKINQYLKDSDFQKDILC